jgi:HAD superfamily hydrolase (TIGR01549 family)
MKAVIFDFDGTIADSLPGVLAIYQRALRRQKPFTPKETEALRGLSLLRIALKLGLPWHKIVLLAVRGQHSFKLELDKVQPFAGMAPLLRDLTKEGVKLYIISTNLQGSIHYFLRREGLSGCIKKVYGRAFVLDKSGKILTLLAREGLSKEDVCYVGDEIVDIHSARRAEIPVFSVSWGYAQAEGLQEKHPDALAATPAELRKILQSKRT